jgi:AcrR family transcriptional regulator
MVRPYRIGQRQASIDETRARVLQAARDLLAGEEAPSSFSIDGVARSAGVARMTVYYQFTSRAGLLEALFDWIANRGDLPAGMAATFSQPGPAAALDTIIATFARFWASDRLVMRRLRGLAILDAELSRAISSREERRRGALRVILERLRDQSGVEPTGGIPGATAAIYLLTSFEAFDNLVSSNLTEAEAIQTLQGLAHAIATPSPG